MPSPKDPVKRKLWIEKLSKINTGQHNPNYGIKKSQETIEKIRQKALKRFKNGMPQETKDKIRKKLRQDRIRWMCPTCGTILMLKSSEIKTRQFCSIRCANTKENNPMSGKENKWGHHTQERIDKMSGENNHTWKGEEYQTHGRWMIWIDGKRVNRARYIAAQYLERELNSGEEVHHIGLHYPMCSIENKGDDRPENLYVFSTKGEHTSHHMLKITPFLVSNLN